MSKQLLKFIGYVLRFLPVAIGIKWDDDKTTKDLHRWKDIHKINYSDWLSQAILLGSLKEYRNLFIYRNRKRCFFRAWIRIWYRPEPTLYIEAKEIGGGLYIQHGFATMIAAERIGENCWINQQVTIGYSGHGRPPIIGDNVMITCGAKVLGTITVGDNVTVGANAVVVKDVEPNVVVGGVPAKIIKVKNDDTK